jgi:crotonobetainyl-CoA:carnitine CoA-transferase CaiB-like acyl-CoA transferase
VYCSISGFGQQGPLRDVPGHDLTYMAWAAALSPDGEPPVVPRIPVADLAAGMTGALQIVAALRKGEAVHLDIAMADVMATWTGRHAPRVQGTERATRGIPGYGTFPTADGGWIALGVLDEDHFWRALCGALGLDEHAGLPFVDRARRMTELQPLVAAAIAGRERDPLVAALLAEGVPVAPVLDRPAMLDLDHFRARDVP